MRVADTPFARFRSCMPSATDTDRDPPPRRLLRYEASVRTRSGYPRHLINAIQTLPPQFMSQCCEDALGVYRSSLGLLQACSHQGYHLFA